MFRLNRDFTSNFREKTETSTIFGCLQKIQTLNEHIIYQFEARDLAEISNI